MGAELGLRWVDVEGLDQGRVGGEEVVGEEIELVRGVDRPGEPCFIHVATVDEFI